MKTLGEIIREKRKARGLRQHQLAELLGCKAQQVSQWELNKDIPHLFTVWDLADIFGCSLDELCGREYERINT